MLLPRHVGAERQPLRLLLLLLLLLLVVVVLLLVSLLLQQTKTLQRLELPLLDGLEVVQLALASGSAVKEKKKIGPTALWPCFEQECVDNSNLQIYSA